MKDFTTVVGLVVAAVVAMMADFGLFASTNSS